MSLQSTILKAVRNIPGQIKGLMFTASINQVVSGDYDSATGTKAITENKVNVQCAIEKFSEEEKEQWGIGAKDLKLIVISKQAILISTNDKVEMVGNNFYNIKKVIPEYVGNIVAYFTLVIVK